MTYGYLKETSIEAKTKFNCLYKVEKPLSNVNKKLPAIAVATSLQLWQPGEFLYIVYGKRL